MQVIAGPSEQSAVAARARRVAKKLPDHFLGQMLGVRRAAAVAERQKPSSACERIAQQLSHFQNLGRKLLGNLLRNAAWCVDIRLNELAHRGNILGGSAHNCKAAKRLSSKQRSFRILGFGEVRSNFMVSIVVPIFNEQENLPELRRRLAAAMDGAGETWEAVLVDDGSRDDSPRIMGEFHAGRMPDSRS